MSSEELPTMISKAPGSVMNAFLSEFQKASFSAGSENERVFLSPGFS